MKLFFIKLLHPLVVWWCNAVDEHEEQLTQNTSASQPEPMLMPGFDAGIPTG